MHSPATSQSDLEAHHADHDDDVAIFDPLQHNDRHRRSSDEPDPHPILRPVPIPAVFAFQLDSIVIRSSQLDPIEDPDSSPRRSPFRRNQGNESPARASPRPRLPKTRLELVSADNDASRAPSARSSAKSSRRRLRRTCRCRWARQTGSLSRLRVRQPRARSRARM